MANKRVRTPRVIQMEAVECGAASLSIVLGYFGRFVGLPKLRVECFVSRDGASAFQLVEVAKQYGLAPEAMRQTAEELREGGRFPAILFWRFSHFLVLEGFGKDKVYLNDPSSGHRAISWNEFVESYSGVALLFSKTEAFQKGGEKLTLWNQLKSRLGVMGTPLSFLFSISLFLLFPGFALPGFLIVFLSFYFPQNLLPSTGIFLAALLGTALFTGGLTFFRLHFMTRFNALISTHLTTRFFWHMLHLPMSFFDLRYPYEIASRLSLSETSMESVSETLVGTLIDLILVIFFGVILFAFDVVIASIALFFGCANLILLYFAYRARQNAYAHMQQDQMKALIESISGIQAIDAIKSRAAEPMFFAKWCGYFSKNLESIQEIGKKDIVLSTAPICFQFFATVALLTVGSLRVMEGAISIGALMGLQMLLINFLLPINRFVGLSQVFQNLEVDFARIDDASEHPIDKVYSLQPAPIDQFKLVGKLEFRNISFGYSRANPPLIRNINFTVLPGRRLAIVGALGSGKSTIAKMILGLYEPWEGEILFDGRPLREYPNELMRRSIAAVDQQIFLFAGSIRDNLTLWNPHVPQEIILNATQDAQIHEEILRRRQGYDDLLIEGGRNLSGGQRQRLEIARSLLYNPSILILDEATSALDSQLEFQITQKILQRGCTLIMIAHRLSTIQDCDEILVLHQGEIAQRGTHEELKKIPGIYQNLIQTEYLLGVDHAP